MMICSTYGVAFIHIPKCAGSSVRQQIRPFVDEGGEFRDYVDHPVLGNVDLMHLPMATLAEHFPDAYAQICGLNCYAVVRDPYDRFRSALDQHLKHFSDIRLAEADTPTVTKAIDHVFDVIGKETGLYPKQMIHFQPQASYVFNGEQRIVENCYRMIDIPALFAEFEQVFGTTFHPERRANQSLTIRKGIVSKGLWQANDLARKLLPTRLYHGLKRTALPLVTKGAEHRRNDIVQDSTEIRAAIEKFYAADFDLFESTPLRKADTPA